MDTVRVMVRFAGEFPSIEGLSRYFTGAETYNALEKAGIGFWLDQWRPAGSKGKWHASRCFVPWTSCLYVQQDGEAEGESVA